MRARNRYLLYQRLNYQTFIVIFFLTSFNLAQNTPDVCADYEPRNMVQLLYFYEETPSQEIVLKCPTEQPAWSYRYDEDSSVYVTASSGFTQIGISAKTNAINLGQIDNTFSGFWCCKSNSPASQMMRRPAIIVYCISILPKKPVITLDYISGELAEPGDIITMICSKPQDDYPKGFMVPSLFWEVDFDAEFHSNRIQFVAKREHEGVQVRCGWNYTGLYENKTSREVYSNEIFLNLTYKSKIAEIDEEVSFENSEPIVVSKGSTLILNCVFEGNPSALSSQANFSWRKNSEETLGMTTTDGNVEDERTKKYSSDLKREDNLTTFSITVTDMNTEDAGSYACYYLDSRLHQEFTVLVAAAWSKITSEKFNSLIILMVILVAKTTI